MKPHTPMAARAVAALLLATGVTTLAAGAHAATKAEFDAAYAAAINVEHQAEAVQNRWTVTESELKAAKKAADAQNFDVAVASAERAEALAKRSVAQAKEQGQQWTDAVVR
jgi:predicted  nucleic acid-binding Zn-ribbon protein